MLTNLEEKGQVKCHHYWPDEKVTIFGAVSISYKNNVSWSLLTILLEPFLSRDMSDHCFS